MVKESGTSFTEVADLAGARIENAATAQDLDNLRFTEIGLDSAKLTQGALFAALPGTRVHGAQYAATSPAGAILTDEAGWQIIAKTQDTRPVMVVDDIRAVLGHVSARIYHNPSSKMCVIGVTGTSGKTTTSYFIEKGLAALGLKVGLIGTTGTRIDGRKVPTSLTTPEATTLQALLATMLSEGVSHVVMEVSSHALELGRVTGVEFDVAGFTNLSQDHLDFHPTMEDYFQAKARFFDPDSPLHAAASVVCIDDEWGQRMAANAFNVTTVATHNDVADVRARQLAQDATGGQDIEIFLPEETLQTHLPVPGAFNIANAALAVAIARAIDINLDTFIQGLAEVAVPGRMERIDEGQDFVAVVDYAHKPAAVAAVLATLRRQVEGRIAVVIGCGGDRDTTKRGPMGQEAAKVADLVVVTDDNPRTEDPTVIRAAVLKGARAANTGAKVVEIADRARAITYAINQAQPGDGVVVVGKGHETGQLVGTTMHHFDDREEVRRALAEKENA